ncbi:unnamed protein product [Boreogadus saida]
MRRPGHAHLTFSTCGLEVGVLLGRPGLRGGADVLQHVVLQPAEQLSLARLEVKVLKAPEFFLGPRAIDVSRWDFSEAQL